MKTKKFILGKGYTHFALVKENNLIITGWDYKGYNNEDLRQFKSDYFLGDLIDLDIDPKTAKILTRKSVEKLGIVIEDTNNWKK